MDLSPPTYPVNLSEKLRSVVDEPRICDDGSQEDLVRGVVDEVIAQYSSPADTSVHSSSRAQSSSDDDSKLIKKQPKVKIVLPPSPSSTVDSAQEEEKEEVVTKKDKEIKTMKRTFVVTKRTLPKHKCVIHHLIIKKTKK